MKKIQFIGCVFSLLILTIPGLPQNNPKPAPSQNNPTPSPPQNNSKKGWPFRKHSKAPATPASGEPPLTTKQSNMTLWYRQPAGKWMEASPIGNGRMGAMVFGRVREERIALNESSFWSGRPHNYNDPHAITYFPKIRQLVVQQQFQEAEKMADAHFFGIPAAQQAYEPIGDLSLHFGEAGGAGGSNGVNGANNPEGANRSDAADSVEDYRRQLDMETGIVRISYRLGAVRYTREIFLSYPDNILVVHITADKPGKIYVQAKLTSPYWDRINAKPGRLVMDGSWKPSLQKDWLIGETEGNGLRFQTILDVRTEGGRSSGSDSVLDIEGATSVTFLLNTATSHINYHDISGDPAAKCTATMNALVKKKIGLLRQRHIDDFRGLMGRVHLYIGDSTMNRLPTDQRLADFKGGAADPDLEALAFQLGRYILVSSSRKGGQPANLQGIWNEAVIPNWGSKYTININTEMNYWPTEITGLSECHEPLFSLLKDISVTGQETAKKYYGHGGWVAHHNTDLWRGTAPVDAARFGMWPMGGAWLCQDVWEHYAYTRDRSFLKEYYPVLKGAAQFLLELMVTDPNHGWLVTPFSMSPEHGYYDSAGKLSFLSPSPTMDIAIIRELFPHCITASQILGLDAAFRQKLEAALKRLPPYQVGKSGFLQEWIEDWKPAPAGHNVSPNFTFYPGRSIRLRQDTALARAIERWMEAHPARSAFPLAWDIAVWARLERPDKVASNMRAFVGGSLAPNLHNEGSNQSDASFGFTAATAESLLQSHDEEIALLPALSPEWAEGSVEGLRARGGYEVNMSWKGGRLLSAKIHNISGGDCKIRYGVKTTTLKIKPGQTVRLDPDLKIYL